MRWLPLLLLTGCTTLSTLEGARTLEPGQWQFQFGGSGQAGGNPISGGLGAVLPQIDFQARVGLAPDLDFGFRVFLLGSALDLRYRFFQDGDWHMAISPGIGVFWLPADTLLGSGSVDMDVPIAAEYVFHPRWSVAFGPRAILRTQWTVSDNYLGSGGETRLDGYLGGFARLEYKSKKAFGLGLSADLYGQPVRQSVPAGSVSIDLILRQPVKDPAKSR